MDGVELTLGIGRVGLGTRLHREKCCPIFDPGCTGGRADLHAPDEGAGGCGHLLDVLDLRQVRRVLIDSRRRHRPDALGDDGQVGGAVVVEVPAHFVADLVHRGRRGQHPVIREPKLAVKEWQAENHQCRDDHDGDRNRAGHNAFGIPVPERLGDVLGDGFWPAQDLADETAHVERIDPVAEQRDHCRHDDQCRDGSDKDHGDTRVAE